MKQHVILSITDLTGSRHFEVRKTVLRSMAAFSILLLAAIPLLIGVAGHLQDRRSSLARDAERLRDEKQVFLRESMRLRAEFGRIQQALDSLGAVANVGSGDKMPPSRRLLKAAAYMVDREQEFLVLEDRIDQIESMLGSGVKDDETLPKRVAMAGLDAALKKTVLDSIPNGCPLPMRGITSGFGTRRHPITGGKEFHRGVDLRASMKTPVTAPADGVVEYAGLHRKSGLGNLLIIRHNFGFSTTFGHLNTILVKSGEVVRRGQKVALTGNSGLSNGPHLHYEVHYVYRPLNPKPFLSWGIDTWDSVFAKIDQVAWESIISLIQLRTPSVEPKSFHIAKLQGIF